VTFRQFALLLWLLFVVATVMVLLVR